MREMMAVEIHGRSFSLNATVYNSRSHRDAFAKLESSTNRGEKKRKKEFCERASPR